MTEERRRAQERKKPTVVGQLLNRGVPEKQAKALSDRMAALGVKSLYTGRRKQAVTTKGRRR